MAQQSNRRIQRGGSRAEPGSKGSGKFFRIVVRPRRGFVAFRNQDVGRPGGLQRLAGRRASGSWQTHSWLVSKHDAHKEEDELVPDSKVAQELFEQLRGPIRHKKGDIFTAKDRASAH